MVAGKIQHWKHGWIPVSPEAKLMLAARRETKAETIRATVANQKAIDRELADIGLPDDHPMRGVLTRAQGSHFVVARDRGTGKITGGMAIFKDSGDVTIKQVRVFNDQKGGGVGTEMIREAARQTGPRGELSVHGAIESAKPFYAKTGATFRSNTSTGTWSPEAIAALKAGAVPPPGRVLTPEQDFAEQLADTQRKYPDYYRELYGDLSPAEAARKHKRR
jgi:hypothetical protein